MLRDRLEASTLADGADGLASPTRSQTSRQPVQQKPGPPSLEETPFLEVTGRPQRRHPSTPDPFKARASLWRHETLQPDREGHGTGEEKSPGPLVRRAQ